ncbi:MAG TPA: helix-turn-helix domain-containing protein [Geobacteraceae bacterium]
MTPEEFKNARRALGMKQTELALALETPYRTVQDWESGRNRIPGIAAVALRLLQEQDHWASERQLLGVLVEQLRKNITGGGKRKRWSKEE